MKAKRILTSFFLIILLCLSGCSVRVMNLTPPEFPPSTDGTYTFKAQASIPPGNILPDSLEALVVIDGKQYPMPRQPNNGYFFDYDYKPSPNTLITRFYYVISYMVQKKNSTPVLKQTLSDFYQVRLPDPIALRLDRERAAVGTKIAILGDQLTEQDRVSINGITCDTNFISPTELHFTLPEMKPGFGYTVEVTNPRGTLQAGKLRVDPANPLKVLPEALILTAGQKQALAFMLDYPAPYGGLYVEVTTDIPDSIIMPEVLIPERARTTSVTIQGKNIGNGHLFINAGEFPEIVVPIKIR